jgi:hypothetical protein
MIITLSKYRQLIAIFLLELFVAQTAWAYKSPHVPFRQYNNTSANRHLPSPFFSVRNEKPFDKTVTNNGNKKIKRNHRKANKLDIGGPGQPEMSSFKSINSNNMVDLFTGDFSYNIPLLDVGGYPVNIHYSSGVSMDQEASWVGLGWNVNPGTINRTTRGLPDDFNGSDSIARTQSIKENRTVGVTISANPEILGRPIPTSPGQSTSGLEVGVGAFHNNYNGWGTESFVNVSLGAGKWAKGHLTGGLQIGNNSQTGLNVQPSLSYRLGKENAGWNGSATIGTNYNSRSGISSLQLNTEVRRNTKAIAEERDIKGNVIDVMPVSQSIGFGIPSSISFATPSYLPTVTMPMTSSQFSFKLKVGVEKWAWFTNASVLGYVSRSKIDEADQRQILPAYGYLYFSKNRSSKSLLDFNREKEVAFNAKTTPHIAVPQYTYDTYSISGEGIAGSFRPYRGDVGYIHDHSVSTKSGSSQLSLELGFAQYFHGGADFDFTHSVTQTGAWTQNNPILKNLKYHTSDSTFEEVYFRNPGEKSINASLYSRIGGDSLVSVKLGGQKGGIKAESVFTKYNQTLTPSGEVSITSPLYKQKREKRSQVISYLKAGDAVKIGLDTIIRSYTLNSIPGVRCNNGDTIRRVSDIRKEHHLSEINVLNPDGRRYVYGLPAYNISQEDVVFSVAPNNNAPDIETGLTAYDYSGNLKDNSTKNTKGKDNYFTKDSTPAHAHSFLLTGILSPDYVDLKGDGITEDDLGDGVKFNYSQVYGNLHNNPYKWRTPSTANKANYNEGLKTYNRDDKGTYLFGSKEVWYLNSIESKTMIAVFKVSNRDDVYSVDDQNGTPLASRPLKKLDSIELYTKADLMKDSAKAKPIKTVHFEYETNPLGQLCRGINGDLNKGKLTLKKVWFSYNKNYKGEKNPYVFNYHPNGNNFLNLPLNSMNPTYNPKAYDRWGNYKDPQTNPGGLSNADYSYTHKDSAVAARYASVWNLTDIKLPSGGKIHVQYEADDYGFVQNKRALQMFELAGFGSSVSSWPSNKLYGTSSDNHYVFINSPAPLVNKADVYRKFLQGLEDRDGNLRLYFRIAVRMPHENDAWNTATKYEMVPTYAEVEQGEYGLVSGSTTRFWLKLKPVGGSGALTKSALQFLRLNLPSKAYPSSEIGDNVSLGQVVKTLASAWQEIKNTVDGFDDQQKRAHHCENVELSKSFVRLGSPDYKKYGGGHRVKRIEISDNWKAMTNQKESVYGQEYTYTTSYVRGANDTIAISSGVAAYEPMIGGEENPFRLPIEYTEKVAPLAPTNFMYTETPLGESFFPSPMVGYSKVRVRTINAKAKSANGWTETEFYTTRDFPTLVDNTPIDKRAYNPKFNILKINAIHHLTVSQGFRIELNDMNGKTKAESIYAENDSLRPIHYSASFYKVENDLSFTKKLSNTVWAVDSSSGHINKHAEIGKEVEIMVDVREQKSTTLSGNLGVNIDIVPAPFIPPFFILPSRVPLPQREESRFRSIAVTKIIHRYGILDSMVVIDKGSVVSTKNLVFDGETGQALVSRTNNEHNDPVYNFSYPARWAYSGMGMAYENLGLLLKDKKFVNGILTENDESASQAIKFFESGDEVWLMSATKATATTETTTECSIAQSVGKYEIPTKKLWAVEAFKGGKGDRGIYFIDEHGKKYTGIAYQLRIIRSGKRNMTDAFVGAITSLANPVRDISPTESRIVIDPDTKVLNATTATFKDLWRVENSLYQVDSCYTEIKTETKYFNSTSAHTQLKMNRLTRSLGIITDVQDDKSPATVASFDLIKDGGSLAREYRTKGVLNFNLKTIPSDAVINSASLNFILKDHGELWPVEKITFSCFPTNCDRYNYDWSHDHRSTGGEYNSRLRRIYTPWSKGTPYLNYGVTTQNEVPIEILPAPGTDFISVPVTNLLKDIVELKQPYYGFMFELQNPNNWTAYPHFYSISSYYKFANLEVNYQTSKDTCVKLCRYNIKDTVNPYRWGILGNWRTDKTIVYYADRVEKDASITQTNTRREGVLKEFTPYWTFTDSVLKATTDTMRWVWNSASSLYNRKGIEIENYDPLGRYNAGLYGYNQTLPIAVAQNSRYREILFDGFEDYSYRTRNCDTVCKTREIDFLRGNAQASIYSLESHTGKSSLLIAQGQQAVFSAPVVVHTIDKIKDTLSFGKDSSALYSKTVFGQGLGLSASYVCYDGFNWLNKTEGPINFLYNSYTGSLPANCSNSRYKAMWQGYVQPKYSEHYSFTLTTSAAFLISSGGSLVITDPASNLVVLRIDEHYLGGTYTATTSQPLEAGKLYSIFVSYPLFKIKSGEIHLSWSSSRQSPEIIPQGNLYPQNVTTADTAGSVVTTIQKWCVAGQDIEQKNVITPRFSPLQGKRMVVVAWLKAPDYCTTPPATPSQINVSFNAGGNSATLVKTGLPVEGWQRYEADVSVPATASQIYLTLSAGSNPMLMDDIRIQPYNSNMKSFVYDPVNLRLMSELDENNYASFYEYDDDGTLVRVKKETEKGIQTIKETRTALTKE